MYNSSLCCCATATKRLKIYEFGGVNVKYFKYKDNVYAMTDDLKIEKEIKLYDDENQENYLVYEEGKTYTAKAKYFVYKGYSKIEAFDTEDEAKEFFNSILKEIGVDEDVQ